MDNPETHAPFSTQDTGRRQTNKRQRKPKWLSRMDNPETKAKPQYKHKA